MTEEERRRQSGTVPYVPTYGEFAAAQNAGKAASNIAAGIMPVTYAQGGAYTPTAATPAAATYSAGATGGAGTTPTTPTTTPGTTPETTPTTTPTTTYGENVDGLTVRQMIERQRQASYADAEKLRERSVIDASTAYAQNKATYGANAEALAGMGLTGGGYGDYLNSRAYAQQREEIQAARAGEAAAKREADRVYYADMMVQKEKEDAAAKAEQDKQDSAYAGLMEMAISGNLSGETIKSLAAAYGITDETMVAELVTAADKAYGEKGTEKQNDAFNQYMREATTGNYDAETIISLARSAGITDEAMLKQIGEAATKSQEKIQADKDQADKDKMNSAFLSFMEMAKSGNYTADEIQSMAKAYGITDEAMLGDLATTAQSSRNAIEDEETRAEDDRQSAAFISLMDNAKSGKFTAEEIKGMAEALGITDPEKLASLTNAAQSAQDGIASDKTQADTAGKNGTFVSLLDMAKSGNYTEEEIRNIAQRMGLGEEDINTIANAAKTAKEAKERENIPGNITADTTDEEISNMIIRGELSESNRAEAEKARTEAAKDELEETYNNYGAEAADKRADELYRNGSLGTEEYQNYYMERFTDEIEDSENPTKDINTLASKLLKAKNDGKISETDYRNAMQYLSERATSALISGGNTDFHYLSGEKFEVTINGKKYIGKYDSKASDDASGSIQNILNNAMGGYPKEGSIALYDEGVYIYAKVDGKSAWYKASRNFFSSGFDADNNKKIYEALQGVAKNRKTPTRPEHKAAK